MKTFQEAVEALVAPKEPKMQYKLPNGNKKIVFDVSEWHDVKAVTYEYDANNKLTGTINHRDQTFQQVCEELEKTLTNG